MTAVGPGRPAQVDTANSVHVRQLRLRDAAAKRGVPLATTLVTVAVVILTYLAMVGGALAASPRSCSPLAHSLTAGIVTAAAFLIYQQIENHVLNPVVMTRTANVNPLLVLLSLLVVTSIGDW